jgi:shikimate dehydrogenase
MREYGLIGYPLTHSFSQKYFTEKFKRDRITDASFTNFELKHIGEVEEVFAKHSSLKGLSVTIPYKKQIIGYLDNLSPVVNETGACNCIKIHQQQKTGFNTDVVGFEKSFMQHLLPHHINALILGTGGAAVAVEYVLKKLGIAYSFVSRKKDKNNFLWSDLNKGIIHQYTIIINCTPVGTYPNTDAAPAIPYQYLTPEHYLFDLVYNPPLTQFLIQGKEHNCIIKNGYEMLVLQAEENWKIWNE